MISPKALRTPVPHLLQELARRIRLLEDIDRLLLVKDVAPTPCSAPGLDVPMSRAVGNYEVESCSAAAAWASSTTPGTPCCAGTANLLFDADGRLLVSDVGLAKLIDGEDWAYSSSICRYPYDKNWAMQDSE